jgi:chemotaxis signal transduction protein
VGRNAYAEAEQLISRTRNGPLAKMLQLFADLKDMVRHASRGAAVILVQADKPFAVSVDAALSIEKLPPETVEEVPAVVGVSHDGVVRRLAKRAKTQEIALLLETDRLMAGFEMDEQLTGLAT